MNIVFVCTGNTCRSPMAEGIFKSLTAEYSNYCRISSCGLAVMPGDTASENAVNAMAERGIDISSHRSRQINQYIIDEADIIICLAKSHYDALFPYAKEKILLLGNGIPDPYMGSLDVYSECSDKITTEIKKLLDSDTFLTVESVNLSDIKDIYEIEQESFTDPWSENMFTDEVTKSYAVGYVCKYLGKTVGYIFAEDICNEVCIDNIAVKKTFRRKNIGDKLISAVEEYCLKNNSELITLEVRESNILAVSLYKKHDFKILGKRRGYYSNPKEDALIMTKYSGDKNENSCN